MSTFQFRLESVRKWRDNQAQLEQLKLEDLIRERDQAAEAVAALDQERHEVETRARDGHAATGRELASLDAYQRTHALAAARAAERLAQATARLTAQQQVTLAARRDSHLLDRLRDRDHSAWREAVDRAAETLASDLFLASLARRGRGSKSDR